MINQNNDDRWRGHRYINLLRCSNLSQSDTSPEGQKAINDVYAKGLGMAWVADVEAEGVSGSRTFNRKDIETLIKRKEEKNDFDVVIVFEWGRLTRGGIRHGNVVEDMMRKAGITVLSATEDLPDGPEGDLIKSVKHFANQQQARNISLSVARGLGQSLERQARPAASRTPYGLDRLYRGPDGAPRMLIRWDGNIQTWYRPDENGKPLEQVGKRIKPPRYGKQAKTGRREPFRGYAKQPDESSELIAGADDRLETLAFMFTAYDVWRWGYHRIAQNLNQRNVPAPEGGQWALTTVRNLLFNPIYLGIEVRHRYSGALYHMLSLEGPVAVSVDQDKLEQEGRRTVPQVERPREQWTIVDKPGLKEVLPEPTREKAMQRIVESLDPNRKPHPKKGAPIHKGEAARQRHLNSPYLLSPLLYCKQTNTRMRGDTVNKKLKSGRKTYRYYFDGHAAVFAKGSGAARRVPAQPLEEAVMQTVWDALKDSDRLEQRVRELVQSQGRDDQQQRRRRGLEKERETLMRRIKQVYKLLGNLADKELSEQIEADRDRVAAIDEQLKTLGREEDGGEDLEAITQAVLKRLRDLPAGWRALSPATLKQLLAAAVEDLTLDLETLEVHFTLVLPCQFMGLGEQTDGYAEVRLDYRWPYPSSAETNRPSSLAIDDYRCDHERQGRQDCYACRRGAA